MDPEIWWFRTLMFRLFLVPLRLTWGCSHQAWCWPGLSWLTGAFSLQLTPKHQWNLSRPVLNVSLGSSAAWNIRAGIHHIFYLPLTQMNHHKPPPGPSRPNIPDKERCFSSSRLPGWTIRQSVLVSLPGSLLQTAPFAVARTTQTTANGAVCFDSLTLLFYQLIINWKLIKFTTHSWKMCFLCVVK